MRKRPIRTIYYSSKFERSYRKLDVFFKNSAKQKELILRENIFDVKLKTHKLTGKMDKYWSLSITHSHRIIFKFIDSDSVLFIDIGDHDIYY